MYTQTLYNIHKMALTMLCVVCAVSCSDTLLEEQGGVVAPTDGKGIGEMVQFAAGTTVNSITTRADGDVNTHTEIPGKTYYMPIDHRFVCRMYYKASTEASAKYDVSGGSDITAWLQVRNNIGDAWYWRNSFPYLDPGVSANFDPLGNDIEATCLYWQNRKEHAFLAWTDLNHATSIVYSPDKFSEKLKFQPADVTFQKHVGKGSKWVDSGYEVYGVQDEFPGWESVQDYLNGNYSNIAGLVPDGIEPMSYESKRYTYENGWSCKYSEALSSTEDVSPMYKKIGWIQYQIFNEKLLYTGVTTGENMVIKTDVDSNTYLYNTATNKYLAMKEGDSYYLTDEYGNLRYDETRPQYVFYVKKLQQLLNDQDLFEPYLANEFDLTRGDKTSISDQPDICQALTKQEPSGTTQTSNRVNLYFKHQFSQIQVNIKSSVDLSVIVGAANIQKVELLGVTEKGYVFTEINENGDVQPANYETVDVSKYTDEQLKQNQYGTAFEMFDMGSGNYPLGYIKAYNAIAFGQLQAIRITWNESADGTGIAHKSTYKVTDNDLRNLKSGRKYVWNIELRRGTLAIVRTEIVDWIVNGENGESIEYWTNGTISN